MKRNGSRLGKTRDDAGRWGTEHFGARSEVEKRNSCTGLVEFLQTRHFVLVFLMIGVVMDGCGHILHTASVIGNAVAI